MFLTDGVMDLGSFIGNYNVPPIIDVVREFKVQSHNDLSEFGAPRGIVNVATPMRGRERIERLSGRDQLC